MGHRITILCLFVSLAGISQLAGASWQNALVPPGEGVKVQLVNDGKANFKIVAEGYEKAEEFLQRGLKILTAVDFTGDARYSIKLAKSESDFGIDGYAIDMSGGNIILSGSCDHGLFNAVTALLEEDLGWRYYQKNQGGVSPQGTISNAKIVPRRYIPPFFQRCVHSKWVFDSDWEKANKTRMGDFGKYFVHTFFNFIPPEEFRASKPEFFAIRNGERSTDPKIGQLCMTNQELRDVMAQRVIKILKDNPAMDFIAISPMDNDGYCQCPECTALIEEEGSPSGPLIHFVNDIAAKVANSCPDAVIVTTAYRYSLVPPQKVKPAQNVRIQIAFNNRIASYPFFFVRETRDMEILNLWSKISDQILVWDYTINFRHYLMPRADLPVLGENIKLYRDRNVSGVLMQANRHNEIGTQADMRAWVCAKLLWNPDLSVEALANDYICGFWGTDLAPSMLKYNALLIDEWRQFHANNKPGAPFKFSKDFYGKATLLLKEAANAAQAKPEFLEQLELEELTLDHYRLAEGLTNDNDIAVYQLLLKKFSDTVKKHDIQLLGEGNETQRQIAQYEDTIRLAEYTKTVPRDHIILPATWNVYITQGLTQDSESLVGRAMRQNADGRWNVQWRFEDFTRLIPGKYEVRIRARADKITNAGVGANVGIYNGSKSSVVFEYSIQANELDEKKYTWIDCGAFEIVPETMYLYTETPPGSAFSMFYIDAVEFIPVH